MPTITIDHNIEANPSVQQVETCGTTGIRIDRSFSKTAVACRACSVQQSRRGTLPPSLVVSILTRDLPTPRPFAL